MPGQQHTFKTIRLHLYSLAAVALVGGTVLFVMFFMLERRVRSLGSTADDYHMAASDLCEQIHIELLVIEKSVIALMRQGTQSPSSDAEEELANSQTTLTAAVEGLSALQDKYGDPNFADSTRQLLELPEKFSGGKVDREAFIENGISETSLVVERLGRLHAAAHDDLVSRIRSLRAENVVYFAVVSAITFLLGLVSSRRSIAEIRAIFRQSEIDNEQLGASESQLRAILDTAADAIITINLDGSIASFNDTASRLFGYEAGEVLGENVSMLMPKPYSVEHDGYLQRYLDTGEKRIIGTRREVQGLRKDGTTFPMDLGITEMLQDGKRMFNGLVRDLSEQKLAQEEIFKLHRALEESSNEIYIFDSRSLKFSYVNRGATQNLGYEIEDLLEMTPLDLKPEFNESSFRDMLGPLLDATQSELLIRTVHKRRDDTLYPVEVRLSIVNWEEKQFFLAVIVDMTEQERQEDERRKLEEQMQQAQKLESLGVLAGGIAHDFNNLLVSILGNADLAREELSPESPAMQSIKDIETATVRAAELCRQMLAYSGKGKFVVESIDLGELVEEMAHLLEVSISKKAVIKYNFADNIPAIEADATQMRQVIMNLIINASDAIGEKSGVISISTGAMHCDREYLDEVLYQADLNEGLYVYLEVTDTGCGMDEETMGKLFDPFFTTKFAGRGLGLAAALGIIRGHHGAVKVYSELGKGTTLKFLIPASSKKAEELRSEDRADSRGWKGTGTILLVDDEETVLAVGKRLLESANLKVLTAADGREAIELFRERSEEIACVLLDLTMPHMDGEETFRELRRIHSDVPVILSSGYNEQEVTSRFVGKGLAGFIQKPYRLVELKAMMRKILEGE